MVVIEIKYLKVSQAHLSLLFHWIPCISLIRMLNYCESKSFCLTTKAQLNLD